MSKTYLAFTVSICILFATISTAGAQTPDASAPNGAPQVAPTAVPNSLPPEVTPQNLPGVVPDSPDVQATSSSSSPTSASQGAAPMTLPPGVIPSRPAVGSPLGAQSDFTDRLVLKKGLKITFPIRNGLDTRWQLVGDYNFITDVEYNDQRGYRFGWQMTSPANVTGLRAVEVEDIRDAHKVSLFYPANEATSLIGFTSIVRISDKLYSQLKSGEVAQFALDGPDSPMVLKRETRPQAHEIARDGYETVTIEVDGMRVPVRAVRARTDAGWLYWILDNPQFPLMLQGTGPFQWSDVKLSYADGLFKPKQIGGGGGASGDSAKAHREAQNVIKQLKDKGQATSYLILFDFDSDRLRPLSQQILTELGAFLRDNQDMRLTVEGHTCTIGGKDYNLRLSNRRAKSVKQFLSQTGVEESRLKPIGYGFAKPVASNKTSAGRSRNRRVVFTEIK